MPLHPNLPGIGVTPFKVGEAAPPAWTPASLPDLELWLPNSFLASIGDAQPIAQWDDASGFARHAVQATGTNQPTCTLAGDGIFEALADGVDDFMQSTMASLAQPTTHWFAFRLDTLTPAADRYLGGGQTRQDVFSKGSTGTWSYYAGTIQASATPSDTLPHYAVAIFNGAGSVLRLDGAVISTANPGTLAVVNPFLFATVGAAGKMRGAIRDRGICSSVLAGDDLTQLETYLGSLV